MKKSLQLKLKTIVKLTSCSTGESFIKLKEGDSIDQFSDKVLLESHLISDFFKLENSQFIGLSLSNRKYLRITCNGKHIYRLVRSGNSYSIHQDEIGLTYQSISELEIIDSDINLDLIISYRPWYFLQFNWYNPKDSLRASYKLGIVALIISIVSLLISII